MSNPIKEYDLFFSYSHLDKEIARELVDRLKLLGMNVWFDEYEIKDFESITKSITNGLSNSKAFICYYSKDYPKSRACQWELTAAYLSSQSSNSNRIIVINPEDNSNHIDPIELRDNIFLTLSEINVERDIENCVSRIAKYLQKFEGKIGNICKLEQPQYYGLRLKKYSKFIGRISEMWRIHSGLQSSMAVVITGSGSPDAIQVRGLGGIGKSLLAEEYALRFGAAYPGGIFWIRAYGNDPIKGKLSNENREEELRRQLKDFAFDLGIREDFKIDNLRSLLGKKLEERRLPYLWIVDDLPQNMEGEEVRKWLSPSPLGKSLISTRSREYDAFSATLDLSVLPINEAFELLTSRRVPENKQDIEAAYSIVKELGGHALAIDIASAALEAYIGNYSFTEFLDNIIKSDIREIDELMILAKELPTNHEKSIINTFVRSYALLGQEGQDLLFISSYLAVAPIPAKFLSQIFSEVEQGNNSLALKKSVFALKQAESLSLADRKEFDGSFISVHTLVSKSIRLLSESNSRSQQIISSILNAFYKEFLVVHSSLVDNRSERFAGDKYLKDISIHAREFIRSSPFSSLISSPPTPIVSNLGLLFHESKFIEFMVLVGNYDLMTSNFGSGANIYLEISEIIKRNKKGANSIVLVKALGLCASALEKNGELGKAEVLQEEVVKISIDNNGPNHPETLQQMQILAGILESQGKLSEAEEILDKIAISATAENENITEDKIDLLNQQAMVFIEQGNFSKAIEPLNEVVSYREKKYGVDHTFTLLALNNLAAAQHGLGNLGNAEMSLKKIFNSCKNRYGFDHYETLVAAGNLAEVYRALNKNEQAKELQIEILSANKRLYCDPNHPQIILALNNIGETERLMGNFIQAKKYFDEALQGSIIKYGTNHWQTSTSAWNLYVTLTQLNDHVTAKSVLSDYLIWILNSDTSKLGGNQKQIKAWLHEMKNSQLL